jgi:hypothetical protein
MQRVASLEEQIIAKDSDAMVISHQQFVEPKMMAAGKGPVLGLLGAVRASTE